jgi:hypothetical protein
MLDTSGKSAAGFIIAQSVGAALRRIQVFYEVSGTTVEVLAIVAKPEAESWLAQFGSPE